MKLHFLQLAVAASLPVEKDDLVGLVILVGLGFWIAVFVIWQLWLHFSPGSGGRSARFQTGDGYIRSNCRFCGGSIEFPAHGLGEWIDCPHCNRQLQLRRMGATERFFVGVRVWCREGSFNWKWAFALIPVVLVCGTALFIYADLKARSAERAKREAEMANTRNFYLEQQAAQMRQQAEEMQRANQLAEEAQEEAKRKASEENSESFASALGLRPIRPSLPRQQLDEMKRANDLAEDANFQHRMDRMHADIQRLTDRSRQQISQPQSSEWVLKYNPYTGRYQYVPPNAQLKYNALENRYEWVP